MKHTFTVTIKTKVEDPGVFQDNDGDDMLVANALLEAIQNLTSDDLFDDLGVTIEDVDAVEVTDDAGGEK